MEKKLLLIGGAGGIGRAIATRAVAEGWTVTVMDLEASLFAHPVADGIISISIDLQDEDSIVKAFRGVGELHGFVNLAGFMMGVKPLEDTSIEEFDNVMGCNIRGAYLASLQALPLLRYGKGAVVNIVSGLANNVRPGYGIYGASKAAMIRLSKSIAIQFASYNIRSNIILPGPIETPMQKRWKKNPKVKKNLTKLIPLQRIGRPEDVANAILFLLSDESQYITGTELIVDGGITSKP